jgi:hypothetical protein
MRAAGCHTGMHDACMPAGMKPAQAAAAARELTGSLDASLSCCMLSCRQALEDQDHAEGILLCVDCFHAVDALSTYKVVNAWPGPYTGCHTARRQLHLHGCMGPPSLLTLC